jgi:transmembrane sensor
MGNPKVQDIIHRYFKGQLRENEYNTMIEALHEKETMEYFESEKSMWEKNPVLNEFGLKNLLRFRFRISQINNYSIASGPTVSLWKWIASVAAIMAIGITIGFYVSNHEILNEQLVFETPRGEKSVVKLPDHSEVWLNANSRLVYHSFNTKSREVELKGEAFFKVTHNESVPFIVKTNECNIKVLGTTFNVMAYDDFGRKEISLISGKIDIETNGTIETIKPGQSLILKDHQARIIEINPVQVSSWVDNKFNFKDIPMSELIKRLENWYDVDIILENTSGKEVNYTGTFKNEETIWQVLDAIKVYTFIEYTKLDTRKILIKVK